MEKNAKGLLLFFVLCLFAWSCSDDSKPGQPTFNVGVESLDFSADAQSKEIVITTNQASWSASVDDAAKSWCTVSNVNTNNRKGVAVQVTANEGQDVRTATVRLECAGIIHEIKINQLGVAPTILVSPAIFTVKAAGQEIELSVTANVEFDIDNPVDWLVLVPSERAAEMSTTIVKYTVTRNQAKEKRSATLTISDPDKKTKAEVLVNQEAEGEYQGDAEQAIDDDIRLTVASGTASSFQPGADIDLSFDGDKTTTYHSAWNNSGDNYFPITLTYNLQEASDMDYLIYTPRQSGSNGLFKEVEIQVATGDNPTQFTKVKDHDFKGSSSAGRVDFETPLKNTKSIRLIIKSGAGDGQGFASCAEMEFFKKNPDNFDPTILFTDATCTELKPGITEEDINAVSNEFFRNLAYYMYKGEYPREFRIQQYKAYIHPDVQAATNKTNPYSLLDNPTGISVDANETLIIMVGDTHGETISLKVQNLDRPGGDGYNDSSSSYALVKGINKIVPSNKGLLYILYHTSNYESAQPILVHIASGKVNGYFDVAKHTADQWNSLLNNAVDKYFDVVGKYAHLTFPVERFKANTPDGKALIDVYDKIVLLEQQFMGLEKYGRMFKNRMYLHAMYTSYMYATSYRTAYNDETLTELTNPDILKTSAIWGPSHEIGHVNQTRPGLKWQGLTEVTNNIHSCYVQTTFGNPCRLQDESLSGEGYTTRYEKAMTNIIAGEEPHAAEGDVFCKLVPFWQLYLYVSKVTGNEDFYKDVYERVRVSPNLSDGLSQLEFVKICSEIAHLDLTDFFMAWGFLKAYDAMIDDYGEKRFTVTDDQVQQTLADVKAMNLPKPTQLIRYITDNTVDLYKAAGTIQKGTIQISGNKVTLNNWKNVAAFELYDAANNLVFVSPASSFTVPSSKAFAKVVAVSPNGDRVDAN